MKDRHANVFYSEEDEGYVADIPDLKYCSAFGETPEDAVREGAIENQKNLPQFFAFASKTAGLLTIRTAID